MLDKNTYNSLLEYKLRNKFFKKEVFLVGVMIISLMVLMFTLNKWSKPISSIFIIGALSLVHLKLYSLFHYREKKYNSLIKKLKSDFKSIIIQDIDDVQDVGFPKNRTVNNSNLLTLNSNCHNEKQQI
jgi:hypothetical protein